MFIDVVNRAKSLLIRMRFSFPSGERNEFSLPRNKERGLQRIFFADPAILHRPVTIENGVLVPHDLAGNGGHQSNTELLLIHTHDMTLTLRYQSAYTQLQHVCKEGGWLLAPIAWYP